MTVRGLRRRLTAPFTAACLLAGGAVAAAETIMKVPAEVAEVAEIAALEGQLADSPPADPWEKARLTKQLDDLRIALAARNAGVLYRKLAYASPDGLVIPAYLFRPLPPLADRSPAVVYAHGMQHGQFSSRALPRVLALVGRGYAVLAPDYRSSTGYGRDFHDAADYGGREIDDMLAARDWLAGLPDVDPARIAILGLSHGGYNALMALARAPGRFAGAVDFFGPTDLVWRLTAPPGANPNAQPGDREEFARMVGRSIDEAPQLYRERSPRYLADRIVDPLLILHGEKDSVVPVQESAWLAEALQKAGHRDFAFHVIAGGEHGYPEAQMNEAWQLAAQFLARVFAEPAGK